MAPSGRKRSPDDIDRHVGVRLKQRRLEMELSAAELERRIDLAPSTVGRFEEGWLPINSATLFRLGRALDIPASYFFKGLPMPPPSGASEPPDPEHDAEAARLLRRFQSVTDPEVRKNLLRLVKSIADGKFDWN